MNAGALPIGSFQLALAMVFVLVIGVTSLVLKLKLERDLLVGTLRTFAQLFLMGYVLTFVFSVSLPWLTLLVFLVMVAAATQIIHGRIKQRHVPYLGSVFLSMLISYFAVSVLVTGVIVEARPWWQPQYFIPLSGMVVGNSMSALAVALERLFADLSKKRNLVEMKLCLGADSREASADIVSDALRAGMMPSINAMMGVGLVFIPGMMTGQILAGADPLTAIRYQIVVMLMLVASAGMGTMIVVLLVRRKCFGHFQELTPRRQPRNTG
jgi:putative ABC transport system permease protein